MAKETLEEIVRSMTEPEMRTNLIYIARFLDEGELPTAIDILALFDRTYCCAKDAGIRK